MTIRVRINPSVGAAASNVTVTTSDCAVTALALEARARAPRNNGPVFNLPIALNGVTRFSLDPAEYVFIVSFKNDVGAPAVTIDVTTSANPAMEPPGPLTVTGYQYESGSMAFLVSVP